jgi:predicted kinase
MSGTRRLAVITVGMTHSGKTTFAHQLRARLPNSVVVDQDTHAAFLNTHYRSLVPVTGPNHLKFAVSRAIVDHAIDRTTAHLIFCNANRSGAARTRLLDRLARAGFTTVLVDFRIAEDLLRQRVAASERSTSVLRASTSFAEVLARQQRASGDPDTTVPAVGDADHLFRVDRSEAVPDLIQAILEIDHGPH